MKGAALLRVDPLQRAGRALQRTAPRVGGVELVEKRPAGEHGRLVRQRRQLGGRLPGQPGDAIGGEGRGQRQLRGPGQRPIEVARQAVDGQAGGLEAGQPVQLHAAPLGLLEYLPPAAPVTALDQRSPTDQRRAGDPLGTAAARQADPHRGERRSLDPAAADPRPPNGGARPAWRH